MSVFPGRCPGLSWPAPLGLTSHLSGDWGLGTGLSPRAAWGHAAYRGEFPGASCQIPEETVWGLATGDWDLDPRRVGARGLQTEFPEASCQIPEETFWELATGDWEL
jgi:hypothetical protein